MFEAILDLLRSTTKDEADAKEKLRNSKPSDEPPTDSEHLKLWQAIYNVKADISDLRADMHKEMNSNTKWLIHLSIGLSVATMGLVSAFGMAILGQLK